MFISFCTFYRNIWLKRLKYALKPLKIEISFEWMTGPRTFSNPMLLALWLLRSTACFHSALLFSNPLLLLLLLDDLSPGGIFSNDLSAITLSGFGGGGRGRGIDSDLLPYLRRPDGRRRCDGQLLWFDTWPNTCPAKLDDLMLRTFFGRPRSQKTFLSNIRHLWQCSSSFQYLLRIPSLS